MAQELETTEAVEAAPPQDWEAKNLDIAPNGNEFIASYTERVFRFFLQHPGFKARLIFTFNERRYAVTSNGEITLQHSRGKIFKLRGKDRQEDRFNITEDFKQTWSQLEKRKEQIALEIVRTAEINRIRGELVKAAQELSGDQWQQLLDQLQTSITASIPEN